MTLARQYPACGGTIASGTLCQTCVDALSRDLDRLAEALNQLDTQLAVLAEIHTRHTPAANPAEWVAKLRGA